MNTTLIVLLSLSLVSVGAPVAFGEEPEEEEEPYNGEHKADCEPGQGWIGYTSAQPFRTFVEEIALPVVLFPCEGEHWDGQDNVQPEESGEFGTGCVPPRLAPEPDGKSGFVGACMNANPNEGGADAPGLKPLGSRVSWRINGTNAEVYVGLDIAVVGRAVVYSGACQEGSAGLEGNSTCEGQAQSRTGAYVRDNTLGGQENILATLVSLPGLTKGYVREGDCDQKTYQKGAENNDRTLCGRDNTAVSVDVLLP